MPNGEREPIVCQFLENFSLLCFLVISVLRDFHSILLITKKSTNSSEYLYAGRVLNKWLLGPTTVFINKMHAIFRLIFSPRLSLFFQIFVFIWFVLPTMQMYFYTFCTCAPFYVQFFFALSHFLWLYGDGFPSRSPACMRSLFA